MIRKFLSIVLVGSIFLSGSIRSMEDIPKAQVVLVNDSYNNVLVQYGHAMAGPKSLELVVTSGETRFLPNIDFGKINLSYYGKTVGKLPWSHNVNIPELRKSILAAGKQKLVAIVVGLWGVSIKLMGFSEVANKITTSNFNGYHFLEQGDKFLFYEVFKGLNRFGSPKPVEPVRSIMLAAANSDEILQQKVDGVMPSDVYKYSIGLPTPYSKDSAKYAIESMLNQWNFLGKRFIKGQGTGYSNILTLKRYLNTLKNKWAK